MYFIEFIFKYLIRTSTLALISLAAYNPIADSYHLAEVAQVSDAYVPANFTVAISVIRKLFRYSYCCLFYKNITKTH